MNQPDDFFLLYKEFAWKKDSEGMIDLYDENVMVFDMWSHAYNSSITEWSGIITDWLGSLKEDRVNVNFKMVEIHQEERVGFARAMIQYEAVSKENKILRSMTNRITLGFIKKGNHWKVIHQHTSAPVDSDLKAILTE